MPVAETITKFNWMDIVVICIVLVSVYRGYHKSLIVEMFKFAGIIFSICISLHYFSGLSELIVKYFPVIGVYLADIVSFVGLAVLSYLCIAVIREVFCRFIKVEAANALDRWGGLALGFFRGLFVTSMFLILLNFFSIAYLKDSINKSYLGSQLVYLDVKVYEFINNNIILKFYPEGSSNKDIYEVIQEQAATTEASQ